jgi:hypothetical protein
MVSHGLISPDLGTQNKERMQVQAEKLKIDAWKGYTGHGLGANKDGWWLDDEKVTYPTLEYSRRLKVKNICVHKGLASGLFNEEHCHPKDVVKVSKDFPDLNFLIYPSGFKSRDGSACRSGWISEKLLRALGIGSLRVPQKEPAHEQCIHGVGQHLRSDGDYAADATRTKEAAIWTIAKTRNFRLAAPVTRVLAVTRPNPRAPPDDGRRGTNARRPAATIVSPAPTQSMPGSSLRSNHRGVE